MIKGYEPAKGILKPAGYVTNGWMKVLQRTNNAALPKRLLNYYLGLPAGNFAPYHFNSTELGNLLRRKYGSEADATEAQNKVAAEDLAQAHYMLLDYALLEESTLQQDFTEYFESI